MGKFFCRQSGLITNYIIQQSQRLLSLVLQIVQFAPQVIIEGRKERMYLFGLCPIRDDKRVVRDIFVIALSYTLYQTKYSSIKKLASRQLFC